MYDNWIITCTRFISQYFIPAPEKPDSEIYPWLLSGLVINALSIALATVVIYRQQLLSRTDSFLVIIYLIFFFLSLGAAASLWWTAQWIVYVFAGYAGLYVVTDLVGWYKNRQSRYDRARFIYPLCCLDLPALLTASVIMCSNVSRHFLEGMAAGHLVFYSFAYFGIAGLLLPFVLERIAKLEEARRQVERLEAVCSTRKAGKPSQTLARMRAALNG